MDRRRYLRHVGAVTVAGIAGCPTNASDESTEWTTATTDPVRTLATGSETAYAASVVENRSTTITALATASGDHQWDRSLRVDGQALSMRHRRNALFLRNGLTLIVTPAAFRDRSWRRQGATPPVFEEGTAYLRTVAGGRTWLESITVETGSTTWRVDISDRDQVPEPQYPVARAGSRLAVTFQRSPLTVRSVDDGSVLWRTDASTGSLIAGTDTTFYVGVEGRRNAGLTAYDAATGERRQLLSTGAETVVPTVVDDILRVRITGPTTARVVVFDAGTGDRQWSVDGYRGRAGWTTPETVYAIDDQDRFVALETADGTRRWDTSLDLGEALPRVGVTRQSIVVGTSTQVTAYAHNTGQRRWRYTPDTDGSTPQYRFVAADDHVVIANGTRVVGLPP